MNRDVELEIADDLVREARLLLKRINQSEAALLVELPDGQRMSIEIAVLPPVEPESQGAMRVKPKETQRIVKDP